MRAATSEADGGAIAIVDEKRRRDGRKISENEMVGHSTVYFENANAMGRFRAGFRK